MLKYGAEINKKDAYHFTPIDYALKNGIDLEKLRKGVFVCVFVFVKRKCRRMWRGRRRS